MGFKDSEVPFIKPILTTFEKVGIKYNFATIFFFEELERKNKLNSSKFIINIFSYS
jgi:hypothetical protein